MGKNNENNPDFVEVDRETYEKMKKDIAFLRSLEHAGVDNWEGYSFACDLFDENYPEYREKE